MEPGDQNAHATHLEARLRAGIAAAKAGQHERARDLLMSVVAQDEENVLAWLWLSGVTDSLDDREICLENVLALDPDNDTARKGLAWVQKQKGIQPSPPAEKMPPSPPPTEPAPSKRPASPAAAILSDEFAPLSSTPKSELSPTPVQDEFGNEYLCPTCAAPTHPDDRKCRACGGKLWAKTWRREKTSCLFRVVLGLQALSTIQYGFALLGILVLTVGQLGTGQLSTPTPGPAGATGNIPPELLRMLLPLSVVYFALFAYSLTVLVGLFLRWMAIFYLYLINALLVLGMAVGMTVLVADQSTGLICGGGGMLLALLQIVMIFILEEDFAYDQRRILLRTDRDAIGAVALLDSGRRYARHKMWAMAAIHLQRLVRMIPDRLDYHLMLAAAYINLKRYDLADKTLSEARRISPDDPQVEKLAAILANR